MKYINPRPENTERYGDGDIPEVDYEPYRNGSRGVTPTDPGPYSLQKRQDNEEQNTPR